MEKILFPLKYMSVTQGVGGNYSHQGTYAIDFGWKDKETQKVYAPFTGVIKNIYDKFANVVWLESIDKVEFADGTIDYATAYFIHCNNVSNLKEGQIIKQGEHFYNMGTAGNATGVHVHIEIAKGKFTGTGWHQNEYGIWVLNNAIHPVNAFFVKKDVEIKNNGGYNWKVLEEVKQIGTPVNRNENIEQIEITSIILNARKTPNGELLGYINKGIYNVLKTEKNGDYTWYQVESNVWIAFSKEWATILPKKEPVLDTKEIDGYKNTIQAQSEQIDVLNKELSIYKDRVNTLENENRVLTDKNNLLEKDNAENKKEITGLNEYTKKLLDENIKYNNDLAEHIQKQPKLVYSVTQDGTYRIKLYKGEKVYINK